MSQEVVCIVPARGGSKAIPKKNIVPVAGKPLLAWTLEQSLSSELVNATFVSTDAPEIADLARELVAEVIPRPREISGDHDSSESALIHGLEYLRGQRRSEPDIVVFLQCTSPLRKKGDIDRAIKQFIDEDADSLISGSRLDDFLLWEEKDGGWVSVNYDHRNRGRRQDRPPQFVENGSIYLFKPEVLRKHHNRIGGKLSLYEMDFWQTWEVDTIQDIPLIEFFINRELKSVEQIEATKIDLIVFDFDGVLTDNKVLTFGDGTEAVFTSRADGLAISELRRLDKQVIIISTETNAVVEKRAEKLGIPCLSAVKDKKETLRTYCEGHDIDLSKVIFVGNDINDREALEMVGWPVCPSDAHATIRDISRVILRSSGGGGVARELLDLVSPVERA